MHAAARSLQSHQVLKSSRYSVKSTRALQLSSPRVHQLPGSRKTLLVVNLVDVSSKEEQPSNPPNLNKNSPLKKQVRVYTYSRTLYYHLIDSRLTRLTHNPPTLSLPVSLSADIPRQTPLHRSTSRPCPCPCSSRIYLWCLGSSQSHHETCHPPQQ